MTGHHNLLLQTLQTALILLHCSIVGLAVSRRMRLFEGLPKNVDNGYTRAFFAIVIGISVNLTMLFCLGVTGNLTLPSTSVVGVLALGIALRSGVGNWRPAKFAGSDLLIAASLTFIVTSQALRVPGLWDDTSFHLPIARFYIEHKGFALAEYLRFPLFPQNGDLLLVLGLMFDGPVLAQTVATLPISVIALGLIGYGITLTSSRLPGLLMTAILLTLGPVTQTLGYAFIDNALAMFCWASIVAIALWIDTEKNQTAWLIVAGAMVGMAIGTKFFGGVLAAIMGTYLLVSSKSLRPVAIFTLTAMVLGVGWYVRSYLVSGDPIHPAGAKFFGYFLWDAGDLAGQVQEQGTLGVKKNLLYLWSALTTAGVWIWCIAIASLMVFRTQQASVKFMQLAFAAYFLFWFFVTQVSRYLAPVYGVGCFLSVYFLFALTPVRHLLVRLQAKMPNAWQRSFPIAVLLPLCTWSLISALHRSENWEADLHKKQGYDLMQAANGLTRKYGDNLLAIRFEDDIFFFRGTVIGDWFGPGRYRGMFECPSTCTLIQPEQMASRMHAFGANMLLLNTDRLNLQPDNLASYLAFFKVAYRDRNGILLTRKDLDH